MNTFEICLADFTKDLFSYEAVRAVRLTCNERPSRDLEVRLYDPSAHSG
jgi:hypothetical protein